MGAQDEEEARHESGKEGGLREGRHGEGEAGEDHRQGLLRGGLEEIHLSSWARGLSARLWQPEAGVVVGNLRNRDLLVGARSRCKLAEEGNCAARCSNGLSCISPCCIGGFRAK